MHLETIQRQWQQLDQKLSQSLAMQNELVRRMIVQPARRRVNWMMTWPLLDILFSIVVLFICGNLLPGNWQDSKVLIPTLILMLGSMGLLISSILQLQKIAEVDWSGPVSQIQSTLDKLRVLKIVQFKWIMLLAPLIGFSGLIVALFWVRELTGGRVSIYEKLNIAWVIANYAFGIAFIPLGYLTARFFAKRCLNHHWWKSVLDGISGTSITAALKDLNAWKNF